MVCRLGTRFEKFRQSAICRIAQDQAATKFCCVAASYATQRSEYMRARFEGLAPITAECQVREVSRYQYTVQYFRRMLSRAFVAD